MRIPLFIQRRRNRKKPPIKLFWWRYDFPTQLNFGDEITAEIIEKLWGYKCEWSDIKDCDLAGTGSIIDKLIRDNKTENTIKVWGSGFMREGGDVKDYKHLDFYAVRGPLSLKRIRQNRPVAVGDPGLLANLAFRKSKTISHKVGIVAHYIDAGHPVLETVKNNEDYLIIDPLQKPAKVIQDITSCQLILSSSLHGLIVADSFGIPNYWMPLSDKVSGNGYKFKDYYLSTGRKPTQKSSSIIENESAIDEAISSYVKVKNIKKIQNNLIGSFPYDIKLSIRYIVAFALKPSNWKKVIIA